VCSMLREGSGNRPRTRVRSYSGGMAEYDELMPDPSDEGPELITPEHFLTPGGIPLDARRMGLDRNTQEGAMLALAGSLNPAKLSHKLVAWLLLAIFAVPSLLGIVRSLS
jgi:hypothetical protein